MRIYHVKKFLRFEYSVKDIYNFFLGNFRYYIYYGIFPFLMRPHIRQQIDYRISVMDSECYRSGSCKICGCKTTHLQMANKACEGNCYPPMMTNHEWKDFQLKLKNFQDELANNS